MVTLKGINHYVGLVLELTTQSYDVGYDTCYIAVVWDWTTLSPKEVAYQWTSHPETGNKANVDATPEVLAAYNVYTHNRLMKSLTQDLQYKTTTPNVVGFTCLVNRGKLLPKGMILTITKVYDTSYGLKFLGIDADGKTVKSYVKNLEVIAVPISYKPKELEPLKNYSETVKILYTENVS